ncbi:hypothetical protein [Streptomyces orinoci]|uniref:Uncharacterized protein n=1 Tax=Streptomyces orinoci TaxID=67339 RepID=A0ABV3JRS4_STRON|nr:hypothetical protein [Streptomyces orinoci]
MAGRLAFLPCKTLLQRCEAGSVRRCRSLADYDDGAVVPVGDWQPLTTTEAERLWADADTPDGTVIELIRLRSALAGKALNLDELTVGLEPFANRWKPEFLGCATAGGGSWTTTEDAAKGRRLGLHVDNWDRLRHGARHIGRRRLCLNLGPGPRYLLIGDRTVEEICEALYEDVSQRYPHTDDIRRYVEQGQELRSLRIRLEPGEGYIAPTELLPHDGSTQDVVQPSTAAFWLGRWPVRGLDGPLVASG